MKPVSASPGGYLLRNPAVMAIRFWLGSKIYEMRPGVYGQAMSARFQGENAGRQRLHPLRKPIGVSEFRARSRLRLQRVVIIAALVALYWRM